MNRRSRTLTLDLAIGCVGICAVYLASLCFGSGATALVSAVCLVGLVWRDSILLESMEILTRLSRTDDLTGLDNDRSFRESLAKGCAGLILFDLDDFKSFNDSYGHPAGDEVLRTLGRILRGAPTAYRIGGDEFAVILDERESGTSGELAEALRSRIRNYSWPNRQLTASFGVALANRTFDPIELRVGADQALYRAKDRGGDHVVVWKLGEA